jgi:hypothetical protein
MNSFFTRLKIVFNKIPIKAKFLKDMNLNISYSGFRYFMQGRKPTPSKKLMSGMTANMGYEYVTIPIKLNDEQQAIKKVLEDKFFADLDVYLEKYSDDPSRTYTKDFGGKSSTATALASFSTEDAFDPDERVDLSDLF